MELPYPFFTGSDGKNTKQTGKHLASFLVPVLHVGGTHHFRRMARHMQRRRSRKRFPCVSLYISLRCDTGVRSCCSVLGTLAPRLESLLLFLPGPAPAHSAAASECTPGSLSVWWLSRLQRRHCKCKCVLACLCEIPSLRPTEATSITSKKGPVKSFMNKYNFENRL